MLAIYRQINAFNTRIINDNWLGKMIFGTDRQYQLKIIDFFLNEIKRTIFKNTIPSSNIPKVIYETLEILSDFSGQTLEKCLNQSFNIKYKDLEEKDILEEQENQKNEEIKDFIFRCRNIIKKWPVSSTHLDANTHSSEPSSSCSDDSILTDIEGIRLCRDLISEILKSRTNTKQLKTYKRFILLIQINCFIRSKGLLLHHKGASFRYDHILKDAHDLIVFATPILWPKHIMRWLEFDRSENGPYFPNELSRKAVLRFFAYDNLLSFAFDDILGLNISNYCDELISRSSIDQVLMTCRRFSLIIITNLHPDIKYN